MALNITPVDVGTIPYPDFTTGQTMHDYLFDENNEALLDKINELVASINNIKTALSSVTDGDSGADNIKATPIAGITGETVQAITESLDAAIRSTTLGQLNLPMYNGVIGVDDWTATTGDYPVTCNVAIVGITENDTVIAWVNESDSLVAAEAEFCSEIVSYNGGITFKAKKEPNADIGIRCFLVR